MKVLLISVNREKMPSPVFPLGLAYIARALREAGHSIEAIDLCFSQDVQQELEGVLQRFQPEVIGLSLRNLDNLTYPNSISYLKEVEEIIQVCRRFSRAKLVMGGSGFSLAPQELLCPSGYRFWDCRRRRRSFDSTLKISGGRDSHFSILPSPCQREEPFPPSVQGAKVSSMTPPDRTLFRSPSLPGRRGDG